MKVMSRVFTTFCIVALLSLVAAPSSQAAGQKLDKDALRKNVAKRIKQSMAKRGAQAGNFSKDKVTVDKVTPLNLEGGPSGAFYAVSMKLKPMTPQQQEGQIKMVVDSSGEYSFQGIQAVATGKKAGQKAMDKISKVNVGEDFGQPVAQGEGDATVTMISDPFCPYCRKAWSFFQKNMDSIGTLKIAHMPLRMHPGAKAASWFMAYAGDSKEIDTQEATSFVYNELQKAKGKQGSEANVQVVKNLFQEFEAFKADFGGDAEKAVAKLSESYGNEIAADKKKASELGVTGTPAVVIDDTLVKGFKTDRYKALMSK